MADQRWRKKVLGNRPLAPETLMMGYGYDPLLSRRLAEAAAVPDLDLRLPHRGGRQRLLRAGLWPAGEAAERRARPHLSAHQQSQSRSAGGPAGDLGRGGGQSLAFASGMAAISTTLWAYPRPGDVIVHSGPVYGGTDFLLTQDPAAVRRAPGSASRRRAGPPRWWRRSNRAQRRGRVAALYLETPANPTNGLVDIAARAGRSPSGLKRRGRQAPAGDRRQHDARAAVPARRSRTAPTSSSPR